MIKILLVEDNEGDILLTTEALEDLDFEHNLAIATDGKEALNMLLSETVNEGDLPDLIFLDMNLPLKNGLEVLEAVKKDPKCLHIPVVILTTSSSQKDIDRAYALQASSFVSKPTEPEELTTVFRTLVDYWVKLVHLPKPTSS